MTALTAKSSLKKLELKFGNYEVCAIPTGLFALDGGAMFGTVPKALWQKTNPADEHNRILMEARALLLKSKDRNILIDTGNGTDFIAKHGEKLGTKFAEIYGVSDSGDSLEKSLKAHGLTPNDITDVILTHLHFDHAGGATKSVDNRIVPTFPNARHHLQRSNYENAVNPNIREKASYLLQNYKPLMESGLLNLIDGSQKNYLPNISLFVSNGHTVGHQVVIIEDDSKQLIYCGDVIPTSSHVRSAWIMGYDINPLLLIQEKSIVLNLTKAKTSYLYFEHDPYCDLASVERNNNDFQVKERFVL
jgi:glyoxylase-like metal-dependent hydrolase (beta-lactamase superfamily II)